MYWGNTMKKTIFYNTNPVVISTRLNEYMKSNFGYEIESDLESLREAKTALEAKKSTMRSDYQNRDYIENMLMLETVKSLLKAHLAEAKPDFLDLDKDGNKKEPMKKAAKDAKAKKTDEGKYKNDAQRKAVHAAKAEKMNEGDAPKFDTMNKKYDNSYEAPKEVKMNKKNLEEGLLAQLNSLLEGDAQNAEITMAARGIVDELQDMIEKLGKIQNDQLGPLTDEMSYSHGPDQSASFKDEVDQAIAGLLGQARSAKDAVNNAVLVLSGEAPASDMGATDMELGGDMQDDMESDIEADIAGGDESAAGPVDEPLGRAKRD